MSISTSSFGPLIHQPARHTCTKNPPYIWPALTFAFETKTNSNFISTIHEKKSWIMLKHKSVLRDARASQRKNGRGKHERTTRKKTENFANGQRKEHERRKRKKDEKFAFFFAKRDGDFVGALCAFSILFPTIPSRSAVSAHTPNAAEQKA
jgi:hypothetical protein